MSTKSGVIVALVVMMGIAAGSSFATDKKDAILIKGTVIGDNGAIEIAGPRDRQGSFEPQIVAKRCYGASGE